MKTSQKQDLGTANASKGPVASIALFLALLLSSLPEVLCNKPPPDIVVIIADDLACKACPSMLESRGASPRTCGFCRSTSKNSATKLTWLESKTTPVMTSGWERSPGGRMMEKYSTTLYTQRAQYLIRNRKKPLFLVLSQQAPHGSGGPEALQAPQENVDKFPYIGEKRRTLFAGMIDALDQSVGEVFETLGEASMLENIVVVFTSDNGGTPFGDHSSRSFDWPLRGTKTSVWEGSTRVPAFVWSPLLKRKRRVSNQLMHFTDWFTTLYSVAGGDTARLGDVDGVDMWQHLSYGSRAQRDELLYNIDPLYPAELSVAAIRNSRYKLVIDATGVNYGRYETPGGRLPDVDLYRLLAQSKTARVLRKLYKTKNLRFPRRWRQRATLTCGRGTKENFSANETVFLFDIVKDPCELNNLAKERPEIVSAFMKRLDAYRSVAVPAGNVPYDPASSPENHNGTWAPWMD